MLDTATLENICLRATADTGVKFAIINTRRDMPDGTLAGSREIELFRFDGGTRLAVRTQDDDQPSAIEALVRAAVAAVKRAS